MNPKYKEYRFPQIKPLPWDRVFRSRTPKEAIDFVATLLVYDPNQRPKPLDALADSYFDELRDQNTRLPDGSPLPDLFGFTPEERKENKALCEKVTPSWYKASRRADRKSVV